MKKIEFSKVITALAICLFGCIAIWSIIEYYSLIKLSIEAGTGIVPDVTLPVTCITVIIASIMSYCLYQFGLKNSRNKYGIDADGNPFEVAQELYQENTEEISQDETIVCTTTEQTEFPVQVPVDCEYKE